MLNKLGSLTRHLVNNRRRSPRGRHKYDTIVRSHDGKIMLFRGKTTNVSKTGARMFGLPVGLGPSLGQAVVIEFLVIPKDLEKVAQHATFTARVWRIEEGLDRYSIAVKFDKPATQ